MYSCLENKIQDRFGFHAGGTFRCAYKNTRVILLIGMGIIGTLAVLIIVNLIYLVSVFANKGSIGEIVDIDRLFKLAQYSASISDEHAIDQIENYGTRIVGAIGETPDTDSEHHLIEAFSPDLINFSVTSMATGFGIYLLLILTLAFLVTMGILNTGQIYQFRADDDTFTVIYPKRMDRTLTMEYDYITGVTAEEWHMPFSPKCLDVTVITKQGSFTFRCIHTPMSKANGICELPFNIIKEKIGLSKETDVYLVHKEEEKFSDVR